MPNDALEPSGVDWYVRPLLGNTPAGTARRPSLSVVVADDKRKYITVCVTGQCGSTPPTSVECLLGTAKVVDGFQMCCLDATDGKPTPVAQAKVACAQDAIVSLLGRVENYSFGCVETSVRAQIY